MRNELVFPDDSWDRLLCRMRSSDFERMALGYGGVGKTASATRLLIRELHLCEDAEYGCQGRGSVTLPARTAVERLLRTREHGFLLDIHSHPGSSPWPSIIDEEGAREQRRCLRDLAPRARAARLVIANSGAVWAAVWDDAEGGWSPVRRIVVPGRERWRRIVPVNAPAVPSLDGEERHARTRVVVGTKGAGLLNELRILVVGCGGTGSALARLLAGYVGGITLCDPDRIVAHNAPRLHLYAAGDEGRFKSEVAAREIARAFPGCSVRSITEPFPSQASVEALKESDCVFCCPDHPAPRFAAAHEAARSAIPLIEVGCGGVRTGGVISALGAHVRLQVPGGPCLCCSGLEIAGLEDPSSTESKRRLGYLEDGQEVAGELMSLTTRAAADAAELFIRYMTGYAAPVPRQVYYDALRFRTVDVSGVYRPREGCSLCGPGAPMAAAGDELNAGQRILEPEGDPHAAL